jgi:hypothetical protein
MKNGRSISSRQGLASRVISNEAQRKSTFLCTSRHDPFYIKCDLGDLSPAINVMVSMSVGFIRTIHKQCGRSAALCSV